MKRILHTLIAMMLIISSFSLLGATIMTHDTHGSCPFGIVASSNCKTLSGISESLFHHITEFQSLTQVLLATEVSVLALLLLITAYLYYKYIYNPQSRSDEILERYVVQEKIFIPTASPIFRWLIFHNKRSTHLISI